MQSVLDFIYSQKETLAVSSRIMMNILVAVSGWSYVRAINLGYSHNWHKGMKQVERGITASAFGLKFVPLQYLVIYNVSLMEYFPRIFSYGFARFLFLAGLYFFLKKFKIFFLQKIENEDSY